MNNILTEDKQRVVMNHACVEITNAKEEFFNTLNNVEVYMKFHALGGQIKIDGNKYHAWTGVVPETDISGFGENPANAIYMWDLAMHESAEWMLKQMENKEEK